MKDVEHNHLATIEAAVLALAADATPAVRMTCQEILDRCFLLHWYEGSETTILPPTLPDREG